MSKIIGMTVMAAAISFSACSLAAEQDKPASQGTQSMHGMQGMPSMHGMMSGGCPMMGSGGMAGGPMSSTAMPQLPPGNEKLQLQMWGEMMQKVGEIASKYAAQLK